MEKEWNAGLSRCTAKTLDKQQRKVGVLDCELGVLKLDNKPQIDPVIFDSIHDDIVRMCDAVKFWGSEDDYKKIFREIDVNNDKELSVDEIHRWLTRKYIKLSDWKEAMK